MRQGTRLEDLLKPREPPGLEDFADLLGDLEALGMLASCAWLFHTSPQARALVEELRVTAETLGIEPVASTAGALVADQGDDHMTADNAARSATVSLGAAAEALKDALRTLQQVTGR